MKTTTLAELRHELEWLLALPDDTIVTFGQGDLSFNRLKNRGPVEGPAVINVELNELYTVTHDFDEDGKAAK